MSNWDFYQSTVGGKSASVYLDLALKAGAPDIKRPVIVVLWLYLRQPDPTHGMSTDAEFEVLAEIEDRLTITFKEQYGAVYAGRVTTEGRREFYFYTVASSQLEAVVRAAMSPFPGYVVDAWAQPDAQWTQYLEVLYPRGRALRFMADKEQVEALGRRGDLPAIARPVTHVSRFADATGRAAFMQAVEDAGFAVASLDDGSAQDSHPFALHYQRAQTPTLTIMSEITALLTRLSEQHGGTYGGWQCDPAGPHARPWWRFWR
ncbi:DUF695 domain-containing protein [Massilia sp. PAMC28688]|uniref:DUF695 domain-containing protein n=1 Tax=Massilia sp. PAMC28688 TaxID=2861283 RepID=UPI001C6298D9|nr:DUF695 domain-containing protein [Massilia sp. PAMC28688]QYF92001.1 DUF695 domain-containing protein [Massilia sp. PAMC28688]